MGGRRAAPGVPGQTLEDVYRAIWPTEALYQAMLDWIAQSGEQPARIVLDGGYSPVMPLKVALGIRHNNAFLEEVWRQATRDMEAARYWAYNAEGR